MNWLATTTITILGCVLIGVYAQSWMLGVGIYCCIAGLGNWNTP